MRKMIIILITSILGLQITSCGSVERKVIQKTEEATERKALQEAEEAAERKAFQEEEHAVGHKAFQEEEDAVRHKAFQVVKNQLKNQNKKKIYDAAYRQVLRYYESEGNQASQVIADNIALTAASQTNRELGDVVGDATVTVIAVSATTAAVTEYKEGGLNKIQKWVMQ